MNEEFLYFIWLHILYDKNNLQTIDNKKVEVVYSGIRNIDSGPDFINAKILIDGQLWLGAIEIHVNASDWNKHNHHIDKIYNSVILHVVYNYDSDVFNTNRIKIPTLLLKFDNDYLERYKRLINTKTDIACSSFLPNISSFSLKSWQIRLLTSRMERKVDEIIKVLENSENSYEETYYKILAKNFGFKVNSLPFQMLAESLPYKAIAKHKDSLLQIEALLYGQAGFLADSDVNDDYFVSLKREYDYLSKKFEIKSIDKHLWKFMRMRPLNFPTLRIAQFAAVLFKNVNQFSYILEHLELKKIQDIYNVEVSEYWQNHYNFGKISTIGSKKLGKDTINNIIINSVCTTVFAYAHQKNDYKLKEQIFDLMENIPHEENNIVNKWKELGIVTKNSFESQSLIELYNEYCQKNNCLKCAIGGKIIIRENYD